MGGQADDFRFAFPPLRRGCRESLQKRNKCDRFKPELSRNSPPKPSSDTVFAAILIFLDAWTFRSSDLRNKLGKGHSVIRCCPDTSSEISGRSLKVRDCHTPVVNLWHPSMTLALSWLDSSSASRRQAME